MLAARCLEPKPDPDAARAIGDAQRAVEEREAGGGDQRAAHALDESRGAEPPRPRPPLPAPTAVPRRFCSRFTPGRAGLVPDWVCLLLVSATGGILSGHPGVRQRGGGSLDRCTR